MPCSRPSPRLYSTCCNMSVFMMRNCLLRVKPPEWIITLDISKSCCSKLDIWEMTFARCDLRLAVTRPEKAIHRYFSVYSNMQQGLILYKPEIRTLFWFRFHRFKKEDLWFCSLKILTFISCYFRNSSFIFDQVALRLWNFQSDSHSSCHHIIFNCCD
jgi:hypothetical protein